MKNLSQFGVALRRCRIERLSFKPFGQCPKTIRKAQGVVLSQLSQELIDQGSFVPSAANQAFGIRPGNGAAVELP